MNLEEKKPIASSENNTPVQIPEALNYEAHITIEPVEGPRLSSFEQICAIYRFRVAKLLLVKDRKITVTRSNRDSFCTGNSLDFTDLLRRTEKLAHHLRHEGFSVWRFKIEATLVDVRTPE